LDVLVGATIGIASAFVVKKLLDLEKKALQKAPF